MALQWPTMSDESEATGRLVRESGKLSALTMASRVLGLIRERTRGGLMGTGALADAFTVAFNIPNLFRRLFAEGSMSVAFIPTVKAYLTAGDDKETEEFLSATLTALSIVVCAVVAMGIAASPALVGLFDSEPVETALLMRVMFPFLALVSIAAFFQGILNAHGLFSPSGFAPILFNLCFIFVPVAIGSRLANPARAMAVGVVAGGLLQALCQLPYVVRVGARFRFISPLRAFSNPGMRRVMALIAPTILGMAAYEVNGLVSTSLATSAGTGAATALSFSIRLQELVLGVFVVSVGTVLLPELSGIAAKGDWALYRDRLVRALEAIALVTVPIAAFSIMERVDIVAIVYKTKEFGDDSVMLTAGVFLYHMLGLPFIGANRILAPAFYARGDARTPAWAGIAAVAVNIVAAVALQPVMGGAGIALALSAASAVNSALLLVMLARAGIEGLGRAFLGLLGYTARITAFSLAASLCVALLRPVLARLSGTFESTLAAHGIPFLASSAVFGAVGIGLLIAVRDPVASFLASSAAGRGSKRRSRIEK